MKTLKKIGSQQLFISLLVLHTVIFILFSPNHFFFEMLQSMAFQITITIFVLAAIFLIAKKWIGMSVSLLAVFLIYANISYLNPFKYYVIKEGKSNLSLAHYNVLKFNENYSKTINSIKENDADVISINEMTHKWETKLKEALSEKYPFQYLVAQNNSFGIGFFSKKILAHQETVWFEGIPYIAADITINDTTIRLLTAHTIPPTSKHAYAKRNNEIRHIENYLKQCKTAVMVIGDFNAVSWSPAIKQLRTNLKLEDSRTRFEPTYPAWNKWLMIPIDHIFYTKEISCVSFQTITDTDSDHYGILGKYRI